MEMLSLDLYVGFSNWGGGYMWASSRTPAIFVHYQRLIQVRLECGAAVMLRNSDGFLGQGYERSLQHGCTLKPEILNY